MLILTRNVGERIRIGDQILVAVSEILQHRVKLGVDAPRHVAVHREEVWQRIQREAGRGNPTSMPSGVEPDGAPACPASSAMPPSFLSSLPMMFRDESGLSCRLLGHPQDPATLIGLQVADCDVMWLSRLQAKWVGEALVRFASHEKP